MKLNVTVAITTVLFVTLSLFEGTVSRTIASSAQIGSSREKRAGLAREKRSWDNYEMDEPDYDDLQDMKNEDTTENSVDVQEAEDSEKGSWDNYDWDEPLYDDLQDLKDEGTTENSTDGQKEEDSEKECDECEEKERLFAGIAGFYDDD